MSGIKTNLGNVSNEFRKFKEAEQSAESRKNARIQEYKRAFLQMGFNEQKAHEYAIQKYNFHKKGR